MRFACATTCASPVGAYPVDLDPGDVDTGVFDTDGLVNPVDPAALGYVPTDSTLSILCSVKTGSSAEATAAGAGVHVTPAIDFTSPRRQSAPPHPNEHGRRGTAVDALPLHLHGSRGARAEGPDRPAEGAGAPVRMPRRHRNASTQHHRAFPAALE